VAVVTSHGTRLLPDEMRGGMILVMSPAGAGNAHFHGRVSEHISRQRARSRWWPALAWLVTVGVLVVPGLLPSAVRYVVLVGACAFLGTVLGGHAGDPNGLKHHRQ
jgi:hypothetical protein